MSEFTEGPTVTVNEAALRQVLKDYRNIIFGVADREPVSIPYYALKESLGESA